MGEETREELSASPPRPRNPIGLDVPDENELVNNWRNTYSGRFGYQKLYDILDSATDYRFYVRQKLAENNMPACLEYLPVVESEYKPTARSRSGAAGLWQFMENSTMNYLVRDGVVDERYDPWKSTDAALKKLQANYRQFGDWYLALAAYNLGAGALQRAVDKGGEADYWQLADAGLLKAQTVNYVPKLLAIADLVMNADYYGLIFPDIPPNYEPLLAPGKTIAYRVVSGDTLWAISRRHNISIPELCELNKLDPEKPLSIGLLLNVPIR
jgi:membrane-bound lytic murein transglycosylase D